MATIEKRGPNQWRAKIRRKGYPSQTKTFDRKSDAESWVREIESEMDRGVFVSRAEAESTTLHEALERFIQEYIPGLAHPDKETRRARQLQARPLAQKTMAAIRIKDIADFIRERESEDVSANTVRLDLATLSRLFEVAGADWGMESLSNPVKRARKPKLPPGRTRRLEKGELERLLEVGSTRFQAIVQFALETAMRRSEIASLHWVQVDLKKRSLYLSKTKNSEPRTVPLSPAAIQILSALPRNIHGSVFGMTADAITKAMRRVTTQAQIPDLTFHDLRHEATSRLFENTDLDAMEIAEITGHKTMQMLKRYSHLRTNRLVERLAGGTRGSSDR